MNWHSTFPLLLLFFFGMCIIIALIVGLLSIDYNRRKTITKNKFTLQIRKGQLLEIEIPGGFQCTVKIWTYSDFLLINRLHENPINISIHEEGDNLVTRELSYTSTVEGHRLTWKCEIGSAYVKFTCDVPILVKRMPIAVRLGDRKLHTQ